MAALLSRVGLLSPASRAEGPADDRRDSREDLRSDDISPYVFDDIRDEVGRGSDDGGVTDAEAEPEEEIDPWDMLDAQAHRKKMAVWNLSGRRRAERAARVQEDRPSLTTMHTDAWLERHVSVPNAVWTMGANNHGQCGHTKDGSPEPHPVALELSVMQNGVRGVTTGHPRSGSNPEPAAWY
jgi:hypothetical protein